MNEGWIRLGIPNYAIRLLYWEAIQKLVEGIHHLAVEPGHVRAAQRAMGVRGDIAPFLELVFTGVVRKLSNRDLIRLDEKTMKVVLLAYLSLSEVFFAWSEVELASGYSDLVLVPSRSRPTAQFGFVVELKYLKSGATEAAVTARLDEADAQLRRYLADPKLAAIAPPKGWKAVSVAFVATEACWLRELGGTARSLGE
jgi:hypothetical protein